MLGHQCLPSLKLMFVARLSPWLVELRFALKASINVFDSLQGLLCTAGFILFCHWGSGRTSGPSHSDIEMSEEEEQESQEVCDEPSVSIAYKLEVAFHGSKPVPIPSSFVVEDDEGKKISQNPRKCFLGCPGCCANAPIERPHWTMGPSCLTSRRRGMNNFSQKVLMATMWLKRR